MLKRSGKLVNILKVPAMFFAEARALGCEMRAGNR